LEDDQMDMDWVSFIDGVDDVPILDWAHGWILMCTLVEVVMAVDHEVKYGGNHQGSHSEYFDVFILDKWEVGERNT
jgi:hypothetical protein